MSCIRFLSAIARWIAHNSFYKNEKKPNWKSFKIDKDRAMTKFQKISLNENRHFGPSFFEFKDFLLILFGKHFCTLDQSNELFGAKIRASMWKVGPKNTYADLLDHLYLKFFLLT